MKLFEETFHITRDTRVLDVGGSMEIWQHAAVMPALTLANLPNALRPRGGSQVGADGCLLPFRDGEFDIVFSNSVIEHVGNAENQRAFAREVARVGRGFWVETPNQGFPVEQHLMLPFIHQLPKPWQPKIVNQITGWQLLTRVTEQERLSYTNHFLNDIRLLRASGLRELFPGAQIIRERLMGFTKSLIALRLG